MNPNIVFFMYTQPFKSYVLESLFKIIVGKLISAVFIWSIYSKNTQKNKKKKHNLG